MLSRVRQSVALATAAGVMIGIGGTVNLKLGGLEGAVLFAVALLTICMLGLHLFTGKVGAVVYSENKKQDAPLLLTCILGNMLGTFLSSVICNLADTSGVIYQAARTMCEGKLLRSVPSILASAFMCGILMYVAVTIFARKTSISGIIFCVPVFILSGYEHSIADMYYFFAAKMFYPEVWLFLALAIAGNALGGCFIPLMKKLAGEVKD
ncbi:MAG: formate/nitrite transporter family protein [Clostridia bacterium]|nr:formate/nitrite transporter family protein [Clostridia bacterium]